MSTLDPKRTVSELKELRALTGNEDGAWRVAWTDTWLEARKFMREKTDALGLETHWDAAGNVWSTMRGESDVELLIGGHIDSVPGGGWLDGCLNVLAGLEVMRRIHDEFDGRPPVTVRLVDWADEEGARFGRSLLGSSAAGGTLVPDEERHRKDADGIALVDALKRCGVDLDRMNDARSELTKAGAYLELHIEQGPVLLDLGLPLGVVLGTFGVERHGIHFRGQAAHSGSTPMNRRRDAFLAAGRMSEEIYRITDELGGVCTIGSCVTRPGIVTSVVAECDITLDQRHLDRQALTQMYERAVAASQRFAADGNVEVSWSNIWGIDPMPFHPELLKLADAAVREASGTSHHLPSGPLHDAAEVARAGVPTVMLFVQSLHGISHNKIEDTEEAHLEMAVDALDRLASKTIDWLRR